MKKIVTIFLCVLAIASCKQKSNDPDAEMNRFINDLMSKMTLEEKVGQLNLPAVGFDVTGPVLSKDVDTKIRKGMVGGVFNTFTPDAVRKLQSIAVNETRLGIPLIFGYDVVHGHKTIFPVPLGLSSSWDMELIQKVAHASAVEASADGLNWTFSPMVDIARDPRWGRVSEGSGEDPYLGACIGKAMVKGYEPLIFSCVKHFALYGAGEAGRDYNTVDMSRQRMYNEYFPPYKAAIDAGASTVMTSFNEIDGMPATGCKWLLTEVLRKEWGFKGFVVTDYTAMMEMVNHGVGDTLKVGELALNAGTDMDMVSEIFADHGVELVKSGRVSEKTVDAACRRILEAKYKLGLFKDPYCFVNQEKADKEIMSADKLELSKEAAIKSMVLLKNDNQVLPLNPGQKIAFIGPQVKRQRDLIGNWSGAGDWHKSVTLWNALEEEYGKDKFLYALGCNLIDDKGLIDKLNPHGAELYPSEKTPQQLIEEAVHVARQAEVVVVALGEAFGMSGEAASRSNIGLLNNQVELLKALKKTGTPIVLLLMNGRPLTLEWEDENMDAILEAWFPGTQGGYAIADVLFGKANPSGKITMTFPRNTGQIPIYYNHKNTGRPFDANQKYTTKYLDISNEPLYPFGYGLSYTTFEYGKIVLSGNQLDAGQSLTASIDVQNTGKYAGTETVQLYIRDKVGSVTRPVKELKGFRQVTLNPGEKKTISFTITENDLKFYNADLKFVAEPGEFDVFIGGNSRDTKQTTFVYD